MFKRKKQLWHLAGGKPFNYCNHKTKSSCVFEPSLCGNVRKHGRAWPPFKNSTLCGVNENHLCFNITSLQPRKAQPVIKQQWLWNANVCMSVYLLLSFPCTVCKCWTAVRGWNGLNVVISVSINLMDGRFIATHVDGCAAYFIIMHL